MGCGLWVKGQKVIQAGAQLFLGGVAGGGVTPVKFGSVDLQGLGLLRSTIGTER